MALRRRRKVVLGIEIIPSTSPVNGPIRNRNVFEYKLLRRSQLDVESEEWDGGY